MNNEQLRADVSRAINDDPKSEYAELLNRCYVALGEQQSKIDNLIQQAQIQAQEARAQRSIVMEIGELVGCSNDWEMVGAVKAKLGEQQSVPDGVTVPPDSSAFAVMSYPLPQDHWLYAEREYAGDADEPKELPATILNHADREKVVAAARYAIRGATNCGKEHDFDPDAMVQNFVYAICGPYGIDAPSPVQSVWKWVPVELLETVYTRLQDHLDQRAPTMVALRLVLQADNPSAPAAHGVPDSLRAKLIDGLDEITSLSRNLRHGGCDSTDLLGLEEGLIHAIDVSSEMLSMLAAATSAPAAQGGDV